MVNSTTSNSINPGDVRKLMSTPGKGKDTSNKKQKTFSNEVTMNGKTYWEYSQHVIYYVMKSIRSSLHSLVDRGDNDGVAGRYARVIETYSDRKVDICGTHNDDVTNIPIVTTGEVT